MNDTCFSKEGLMNPDSLCGGDEALTRVEGQTVSKNSQNCVEIMEIAADEHHQIIHHRSLPYLPES